MDERDKTRIKAESEIDQGVAAVNEFVRWFNGSMDGFAALHETLSTDPKLPITLSGEEREIAHMSVLFLARIGNLHFNFQIADENKPE